MLLRFEVSNHRSIMEPIELSMVAVDKDRPAARAFEMLSERALTVAGVYGPNASGKSNVLDALRWLSWAVRTSLRSWTDAVPRDPFRFAGGPEAPSTFEVEMMVHGVRYRYRLEVDDLNVRFESLESFPKKLARTLIERRGSEVQFRRGLPGAAGTRELLTPTTLALSAAMRVSPSEEIREFARALAGFGAFGFGRRNRPMAVVRQGSGWSSTMPYARTERLFVDFEGSAIVDDERQRVALALLRFADLGITGVDITPPSEDRYEARRPTIRLMHRSHEGDVPLDLVDESDGTRTWFQLIGPLLRALATGQTLLFDEIDSSLHPTLSARLVEMFQSPETNPLGAQLIFTTHDTSLLGRLNRDEVWLTAKGSSGATELMALAEFGGDTVRRSLNLERAYLQGRFGALPDLDQSELRIALGVVDRARRASGPDDAPAPHPLVSRSDDFMAAGTVADDGDD